MRICKEDKKLVRSESLKTFVDRLTDLAFAVNELFMIVTAIQYFDGHLEEGSVEERKRAGVLIKEIIRLTSELKNTELSLKNDANLNVIQKQSKLDLAKENIMVIRRAMLELWDLKNTGKTQKDNDILHGISLKLFTGIAEVIKDLQNYVKDFNKTSLTKLKFSIKWTDLPK